MDKKQFFKHSVAAVLISGLAVTGFVTSYQSSKFVSEQRMQMLASIRRIEDNQKDLLMTQQIQVQVFEKVKELESEIIGLKRHLYEKKILLVTDRPSPSKIRPALNSRSPKSNSKSEAISILKGGGDPLWSEKTEREREAWRKWAAEELTRLKKNND